MYNNYYLKQNKFGSFFKLFTDLKNQRYNNFAITYLRFIIIFKHKIVRTTVIHDY